MFNNIYAGRRVLLTGHTGFKGSWLALWLRQLGAEVCGVALPMETPNHFELLNLELRSEFSDIRDGEQIKNIFTDFKPEIVFHLAAQPLVRRGYREPDVTFEVNVIGTVNVLEAVRRTPSVKAVVAVSSDKCYENIGLNRACRETDPMGGYDPYSASKGCMELVVSCYRRSFFNTARNETPHRVLLAGGRAGNVVGGGDWAADRLVPDLMKAAAEGRSAEIRSPHAVRPWQHVLEPLSGYLSLGQRLLQGETAFADGWNFGPADNENITVEQAVDELVKSWSAISPRFNSTVDAPHEAEALRLDSTKARSLLDWHGVWSPRTAFQRTAEWYKAFYCGNRVNTPDDLAEYIAAAREEKLAWTK